MTDSIEATAQKLIELNGEIDQLTGNISYKKGILKALSIVGRHFIPSSTYYDIVNELQEELQ